MSEIISYIFTFAFLTLPIGFGGVLLLKTETSRQKWFIFLTVSTVVCYFCILFSVGFIDFHYKHELDKFDLDGDGVFSGEELTPEMDMAMKRLTNDTGKSFAPITGAIISPIYNGFWFMIFALFTYIKHEMKTKRRQLTSSKDKPS